MDTPSRFNFAESYFHGSQVSTTNQRKSATLFALSLARRKGETWASPDCRYSLNGSMIGDMNLGFGEMVFIFMVALIIFGPKKLPEIGRQIGKALNEFKRASNEFKAQIEAEISQIETKSEPQILPPAYPPRGSIAAHFEPEPALTLPEAAVVPVTIVAPETIVVAPETIVIPEVPALPEESIVKAPDA
jgi:TatA/E family protein of Tat protein translocase